MKIVLVAMNASYMHTALAAYCLCDTVNTTTDFQAHVIELNGNAPYDKNLYRIVREKPDCICFSCYIWNIVHMRNLMADIKSVLPHTVIIAGGPEVSYDADLFLRQNRSVQAVLCGEAEEALPILLQKIFMQKMDGLPSCVAYRTDGEIVQNTSVSVVEDLHSVSIGYSEEYLADAGQRIVYYESSRGCPYACTYCLSSLGKGVRTRSLDRVSQDLELFDFHNVRLIKFTDRTFNFDRERTAKILSVIGRQKANTCYHIEIAADLIDEGMIEQLRQMPPARIQIEAGFQSAHRATLEAIHRQMDFEKAVVQLKKVVDLHTVHVHTDVIAGLPYETKEIFEKSFDRVASIEAHYLQLGFLKLLKGTALRTEYIKRGDRFMNEAPYEVLHTQWISFDALADLKRTEQAVSLFHNTSHHQFVIEYIHKMKLCTPYQLYELLGRQLEIKGYHERAMAAVDKYAFFEDFCESRSNWSKVDKRILSILMKIDLVFSFVYRKIPHTIKQENPFYEKRAQTGRNTQFKSASYFVFDADTRELMLRNKETFTQPPFDLPSDVWALKMDYDKKDPITGRYYGSFLSKTQFNLEKAR